MKKRMFHKGMAAVLAVSLTTGGALPFMAQTVHAEDTAAEQGQTPEKKSGTVTLEKKNDGTYVFGNEYLKRTFSLSADKVLSTKEITNYRTGTPTVFTPQAGSEEFIINTRQVGRQRRTALQRMKRRMAEQTRCSTVIIIHIIILNMGMAWMQR